MDHLERAEQLVAGYSGKVSELAEAEAHASIAAAQALTAIVSELHDLGAELKALFAQGQQAEAANVKPVAKPKAAAKPKPATRTRAKKTTS